MTKIKSTITDLSSSINQLEAALQLENTLTNRDSAIKRFELTFDLAWKSVKTHLESQEGIIVKSPKDAFREAYRQGLITYEPRWLKLVDLRNQSVHEYDLKQALKIYRRLPTALKLFKSLLTRLDS